MKFFPLLWLLIASYCSYAQSNKTTDPKTVSDIKGLGQPNVEYPYSMVYSANFKFIDHQKGKMVLTFIKDFEVNTIENSASIFADKVTIDMPSLKLKASRDSIMTALKIYRNSFHSIKTELDVVMSVKSTDKGDEWVLLWAVDEYTGIDNCIYLWFYINMIPSKSSNWTL